MILNNKYNGKISNNRILKYFYLNASYYVYGKIFEVIANENIQINKKYTL